MPRPKKPRKVPAEANIAERVRRARSENGWSYAAFAARMTELGCPVHASAIQRIESGDPPRSISADEALVIAAVLGVSISRLYQHPDDDVDPHIRLLLESAKQDVDTFRFYREEFLRRQEELAQGISNASASLLSMFDSDDEALEVIFDLFDYLDADEKKWFGPSFPPQIRRKG